MTKAVLSNKNCFLISFFCLVASFGFLQAQEKKSIANIEKIYLHTDRSRYYIGEDLWYKAYNVRAYNNILFDNSNVLYVELIAPDSKIVAKNKTNIEMGLGYGDFKIADSLNLKTGVYQLRAYTNWDRNFGEDFIFKKEIEIIDVFESHANTNKTENYSVEIKTTGNERSRQNGYTVDFFPEGGSLIENVASIIGFKAVDSEGKPIDVKGEVYDSDNELVASFLSPHDGMGKFQMLPISGKNYYAKIKTLAGAELRVALPKVTTNGYLISFRAFKGRNIISINTNEATLAQNPNATLTIVCKARGISFLETTETLSSTSYSFELPKDKTPEGISQITIFDKNNVPQSERLVFVEKEQDLVVQIATDKAIYKPNEKVSINVSSKSKEGTVKAASYSLSVTDMNGILEDKDYGTSISSYFLMESDIRGKVYNPAYYFDINNVKRLDHLDDLLLTQGWRDFVWKSLPTVSDTINYTAEKGFTISGRVKQLLGEKALVNNTMTMALMNKKNFNIFNVVTDSLGMFKFEDLMFSGKTNMFINSRNVKGKFRGELLLDPIELDAPFISFSHEPLVFSLATQSIVDNVFKKFVAFGIKPENILDEVSIVAKKKDKLITTYGIPEFSYLPDENTKTFTDIYQLMEQTIPGIIASDDSVRFTRYSESPLFIIDGFTATDRGQVSFIQPEDVLRIDVVKGTQATAYYGNEAENGLISIFTKQNTGQHKAKEVFHSIKKEIEGYYNSRIFYSPTPDKPNPELDTAAAVRNTLYWNPYVHPDKTGNVSVYYFNTKVETKVKVNLEGMTSAGVPVVKNTYYTIQN